MGDIPAGSDPGGRYPDAVMGASCELQEQAGPGGTDLAEFLRTHLPTLMRYGIALTGNPHDGADLVQMACEKAAIHWHRISGSDTAPAYIKAVMANSRISIWRKRRGESLLAQLPETTVVEDYPADQGDIWAAVAALPRKQRAVIVLRYVEGHSEAEIARILKISVGTVKSHSSRAIGTLRRTTDDQGDVLPPGLALRTRSHLSATSRQFDVQPRSSTQDSSGKQAC